MKYFNVTSTYIRRVLELIKALLIIRLLSFKNHIFHQHTLIHNATLSLRVLSSLSSTRYVDIFKSSLFFVTTTTEWNDTTMQRHLHHLQVTCPTSRFSQSCHFQELQKQLCSPLDGKRNIKRHHYAPQVFVRLLLFVDSKCKPSCLRNQK